MTKSEWMMWCTVDVEEVQSAAAQSVHTSTPEHNLKVLIKRSIYHYNIHFNRCVKPTSNSLPLQSCLDFITGWHKANRYRENMFHSKRFCHVVALNTLKWLKFIMTQALRKDNLTVQHTQPGCKRSEVELAFHKSPNSNDNLPCNQRTIGGIIW